MKILTIAKNGQAAENSIRFDGDTDVFAYLHRRYGGRAVQKLAGRVWLNDDGVSRMTFEGTENLKALPDADGLVFFVDSEDAFKSINDSLATPQAVVDAR